MLDVKLMRWLDNALGNVTLKVFAAAKRVRPNEVRSPQSCKKFCVMKFFGLGSIVVASRAMLALRREFPDAELHFVTFKGNVELLELLNIVDKIHFVDPSSPAKFVRSTLKVAADLRAAKIDIAIDLEFFAKFPLTLASLAGIPQKAGFYLTSEDWRRTLLDVPGWYNHYFHTSDIFLSLVYLLAREDYYYTGFKQFAAAYTYPRVDCGEAARASLRKCLQRHAVAPTAKLFVLNPNTSPDLAPEARKWPEERYADLADTLLRDHPGATVAYIGVASERAYVARIVAHSRDTNVINLAGQLNLRELLALFERAQLVVSNDSGPMHLACLVDAPVVGLFFADTPTLFAPLGSRVASVAPDLYSIPLFTVYNGKDVIVGKPTERVRNVAAQSVSVKDVMDSVARVLTPGVRGDAEERVN
jgi:ADP-heptose:LPS heptosyltransferase